MNKLAAGVVLVATAGVVVATPNVGCRPTDARPPAPPSTPQVTSALNKPRTLPAPTTTVSAADGGAGDGIVGQGAGQSVSIAELQKPLVEAYGLNVLLNVLQMKLATADAQAAGFTVGDADVAAERQRTVDKMFQDANARVQDQIDAAAAKGDAADVARLREQLAKDNEQALEQLLANQRVTRPEFDMVMRTNAALRKIAEKQAATAIGEQDVRDAFGVQYGEKAKARHIQLNNLQEVAQAKAKLAAGEPFEQVAKDLSRNTGTRPLGGELPPFTRSSTTLPQAFRDTAFATTIGEVSEPVMAEGAYHLIKVEAIVPPSVVKFEDVKDSVRASLQERLIEGAVKLLRQQVAQRAMEDLVISDPALKRQYEQRMEKQQSKIRDRDSVRRELERQRERLADEQLGGVVTPFLPATRPTTEPTTAPAPGQ
ncbi:MAG TPA: peptidyl-prolyl cis-trans isomerase [Tepidisphaeraceae bacterium]|nr:peptidyl-prolyl cis-trans isomerase [Tepidisphaeraceae bacterium]